MSRLIWSPRALLDVRRLHSFLASKNNEAATKAVRAIRQGVKLLEQHPEAGRPAEDMPVEFREWPIDFGSAGYVVLYRVDQRGVVLLTVRHGREERRT